MELWFVALISGIGGVFAVLGAYFVWMHVDARKRGSDDAGDDSD